MIYPFTEKYNTLLGSLWKDKRDAASVRCCSFAHAALYFVLCQMPVLCMCVMTWFKKGYREGWKIAVCGFGRWGEEGWGAVVLFLQRWAGVDLFSGGSASWINSRCCASHSPAWREVTRIIAGDRRENSVEIWT